LAGDGGVTIITLLSHRCVSVKKEGIKLNDEYLLMCHDAYKYLSYYNKPGVDNLYCDCTGLYLKQWNESVASSEEEWRFKKIKEEWKNEDPFRVWRQEDLQYILATVQMIDSELDLIKAICSWGHSMMEWIDFLDFNLNQYWLAFVMHIIYGMVWDREKKEWVKK
jgi:hypothetical protein